VIVEAGDADAAGDGDGEGVGTAANADWQRNINNKQEIFITHHLRFGLLVGRLRTKLANILIGQRDRWFGRAVISSKTGDLATSVVA
jgi:hypothetical protein